MAAVHFTTIPCEPNTAVGHTDWTGPTYNFHPLMFHGWNLFLLVTKYLVTYFTFISAASRENHVKFGDCAVGVSRQLSFTLTNHSSLDPIRFTWSPPPEITFSPCTGHLQADCAKDVTVTFCSMGPETYSALNIPCKVTKIKLGEAQDKVNLLLLLYWRKIVQSSAVRKRLYAC